MKYHSQRLDGLTDTLLEGLGATRRPINFGHSKIYHLEGRAYFADMRTGNVWFSYASPYAQQTLRRDSEKPEDKGVDW